MTNISAKSAAAFRHRIDVSVIVPVYGCVGTLQPLHARLTQVFLALGTSYEIIFVDDRANDGSWQILQDLARQDSAVVACRMSRNVGQQLAITAGLEQCSGAYAVVMDCDLQDPPEVIPLLIDAAKAGFDIVFARRKSDHQPSKRLFANWLYFSILGMISGRRFDGEFGAFSIISRRVIDAFLQFRERDRHYLMILYDIGFERTQIEYERATRTIGESSYTLSKLISHAVSGLVFTTTRVLHGVIYTGLSMAGAGFILALLVLLQWITKGAAPGWTSLIIVQLLIGGIVTLCLGITGLYVGKIFETVQSRPLYFVQDRIDSHSEQQSRGSTIDLTESSTGGSAQCGPKHLGASFV